MRRLDHYWQDRNFVSLLLLPLSWLFCLLVRLRRLLYHVGFLRVVPLPVPVIVVGNITVGGSGKTPLVIWLAKFLRQQGYQPGIVSRGYGGKAEKWPQAVEADSDPQLVGDEPVLIVRRTGCPMVVGPDRVAAAQTLLAHADVNIIISDDGMQHYRLCRTVEIAVIDAARGLGNGHCLPAGPLREPAERLQSVDLIVVNGGERVGAFPMRLDITATCSVPGGEVRPLSQFRDQRVHAVAGIGHPARFFAALRGRGIAPIEHPMPDHHAYRPEDVSFGDSLPVLMTEKDAVKCQSFTNGNLWAVAVEAELAAGFGTALLARLKKR